MLYTEYVYSSLVLFCPLRRRLDEQYFFAVKFCRSSSSPWPCLEELYSLWLPRTHTWRPEEFQTNPDVVVIRKIKKTFIPELEITT